MADFKNKPYCVVEKRGISMNAKLQWLRNNMSSLDLQGLILTNPDNIRYLTNMEAEGILLLTKKKISLLQMEDI